MHPPLIIYAGIPDNSRAAMVSVAGVGIPPGLMGIPSMQRVLPHTSISASAAGVKSVSSGVSPASETPGIVEVSVLATVHVKTPLPPQISERILSAISLFPTMLKEGGNLNSDIVAPIPCSHIIYELTVPHCNVSFCPTI